MEGRCRLVGVLANLQSSIALTCRCVPMWPIMMKGIGRHRCLLRYRCTRALSFVPLQNTLQELKIRFHRGKLIASICFAYAAA